MPALLIDAQICCRTVPSSQPQPHLLTALPLSLARQAGLRRPPPPFTGCGTRRPSRLPPLAAQPHRLLLRIPLAIERQQSGQNVVADGIGPAVTPGQLLVGLDDPVVAQLGLEGAGFGGGGEEEIAAGDALL